MGKQKLLLTSTNEIFGCLSLYVNNAKFSLLEAIYLTFMLNLVFLNSSPRLDEYVCTKHIP